MIQTHHIAKYSIIIISVLIGITGLMWVASSLPGGGQFQTMFNGEPGEETIDQLILDDFITGQELITQDSTFDIPLTENALPSGTLTTKVTFDTADISPGDISWKSIVTLNGGKADDTPVYQIILMAKKVSNPEDPENPYAYFGLKIADPAMKSGEKGITAWGKDGKTEDDLTTDDAFNLAALDSYTLVLTWGDYISASNGGIGTNAKLQIKNTETKEVLYTAYTIYTSAAFYGGNTVLTLGEIQKCGSALNSDPTRQEAWYKTEFITGTLQAIETGTNVNTTYTCNTRLYDLPITDLPIPLPAATDIGIIEMKVADILPVDITEVTPDAGTATVSFKPSTQEEIIIAKVDSGGNGDFYSIEEALSVGKKGIIAIASGEYYVDSLTIPDGITLSGGWDNVGFRTQDFVNNPTYIFQSSDADSVINLAGESSNIEGLIITGKHTCVKAYGRANKITNNAFRKCDIGIDVFGTAYAHIVSNTFYDYLVGVQLDDYGSIKVVKNAFSSLREGSVYFQNNSIAAHE